MRIARLLCVLGCLTLIGCFQPVPLTEDDADSLVPADIFSPTGSGGDGDQGVTQVVGESEGSQSDSGGGLSPDSGNADDPPPPDNTVEDPPPGDSSGDDPTPSVDESLIPGGDYAGQITASANFKSRSAAVEAPHIGNLVRINEDGIPYVADRWLSDGGGVAFEGLTTWRLVEGPDQIHLVRMTIEKMKLDSDVVELTWGIDPSSPYYCDPGSCVDRYTYDSKSKSLAIGTSVQLKWEDNGEQTLTVTGQGTFALR